MFRRNRLKGMLGAGHAAFGGFSGLGSAAVAEVIAQAGCDFVLIDGEHGLGDRDSHLHCIHAIATTSATALFRVPSDDPTELKRALDMGIEAVMVPGIATAKQAEAVVAACRYAPRGVRGYAAPYVRASDYGQRITHYLEQCEREFLLVGMIESVEGLKNAHAIAATDGIDVVQIGTLDLAYEMGLGTDLKNPHLAAAIREIEEAVRAAGKPLGGVLAPGISASQLLARGYRLITVGFDTHMLGNGFTTALGAARSDIEPSA